MEHRATQITYASGTEVSDALGRRRLAAALGQKPQTPDKPGPRTTGEEPGKTPDRIRKANRPNPKCEGVLHSVPPRTSERAQKQTNRSMARAPSRNNLPRSQGYGRKHFGGPTDSVEQPTPAKKTKMEDPSVRHLAQHGAQPATAGEAGDTRPAANKQLGRNTPYRERVSGRPKIRALTSRCGTRKRRGSPKDEPVRQPRPSRRHLPPGSMDQKRCQHSTQNQIL